jgi:hypothetical protein
MNITGLDLSVITYVCFVFILYILLPTSLQFILRIFLLAYSEYSVPTLVFVSCVIFFVFCLSYFLEISFVFHLLYFVVCPCNFVEQGLSVMFSQIL